uniref:Disease resistance R13L4/SHOC-2-like LRR domain-containing protein n=1 Tax=Odontella aurita TaxID=265563 RepID=A0A7S4IYT7_9STRA|mmetsp:Transcript_33533/g.99927  ORF Transcript_33533/g.99927 Transcript_33533/m.99927 type:complete len:391 (+) Transcript_33533:42-1214(+)
MGQPWSRMTQMKARPRRRTRNPSKPSGFPQPSCQLTAALICMLALAFCIANLPQQGPAPLSIECTKCVGLAKRLLEALTHFHLPEAAEFLKRFGKVRLKNGNVLEFEGIYGNPRYTALEWLAMDESLEAPSSVFPTEQLVQRYALAVLYFATHGDQWNRCSRRESSPCESTLSKKGEMLSSRFLSSSHVCYWYGVTCSSDNQGAQSKWMVTWIDLTGNGLDGTLPDEVALFGESLELLWLANNPVSGQIPLSIGHLSKLQTLSLAQTAATGTLPNALFDLKHLISLRLYESNFSGPLSTKIDQLSNLEWLWLHHNSFTGSIPGEQLGRMKKLESLTIHQNRFENNATINEHDLIYEELCRSLEAKGRHLQQLWADCGHKKCSCCTKCFSP